MTLYKSAERISAKLLHIIIKLACLKYKIGTWRKMPIRRGLYLQINHSIHVPDPITHLPVLSCNSRQKISLCRCTTNHLLVLRKNMKILVCYLWWTHLTTSMLYTKIIILAACIEYIWRKRKRKVLIRRLSLIAGDSRRTNLRREAHAFLLYTRMLSSLKSLPWISSQDTIEL